MANLTISTHERRHIGTHVLLITEKSLIDPTVLYERWVTVVIEDYCLGAEVDLSKAHI